MGEVPGRRVIGSDEIGDDQVSGKKPISKKLSGRQILCHPCESDGEIQRAEQFCSGCHQYMCSNCASFHLRFDAYKDHRLTKLQCYPCKSASETRDAKLFCLGCNQYMCDKCARLHLRFDAHKDHVLIQPKDRKMEKRQENHMVKTSDVSKMSETFQSTLSVTNNGDNRAEKGVVTRKMIKEEGVKNKTGNEDSKTEQKEQIRVPPNMIHQRDIHVGMKGDRMDCWVTGSVYMGSNRLAIVDSHNNRVSVVDILQGNIILHITFASRPWDITYTDQNQLVVTAKPYLVFLNVGKTLTVNKKLNVGGDCRGIDYTDNILIVSFENPGLVTFMNMDGQVIKSISKDMNGEPLFYSPWYVVASRDKKAVHVTDRRKNTVTKLDMNGTVIDVYRSKELRYPRGVTVDKYDNVYITGWWSDNVCVLTAGSRQYQPILKLNYTQSVVICDDSDQMVVSHYDRLRDEISIYKIHRSK